MNDNFTKIVALIVVGGVAKALFATPRPVYNSGLRDATISNLSDATRKAAESIAKDTGK